MRVVSMRIVAVLILAVLAGQAMGAFVSLVPESCAQACGDDCFGDPPAESCPPLCTHCPGCCVPQVLLPGTDTSLDPLGLVVPLPHPTDEFRISVRESDIFHVPKAAA